MEIKLGQSFQLSDVTNKSELLQKYVHAMQTNLRFIVMYVEGYLWLLALKQTWVNEKIKENRDICSPITCISLMKKIDITQA